MSKKLISVFAANIIYLFLGLLYNFLMPMLIPIDQYAVVKTYSLYIFYSGFFHLGYNDGMYLKYGGKEIKDISADAIFTDFFTLVAFQFVLGSILFFASFGVDDTLFQWLIIGIVNTNIVYYFKYFYQATGEMKQYGIILNMEKFLPLIINLLLLFALHIETGIYFVGVQVVSIFLINIVSVVGFFKCFAPTKRVRFSLLLLMDNIKIGFLLMLGNFSNNIFTGIDRWFVKNLMSNYDFAMYSFAVSLENMIGLLISPISIFLYNYFSKGICKNNIYIIKKLALFWGMLLMGLAFPIKYIVGTFLSKYEDALVSVFLLFATQMFYSIIKTIYVNLYKVNRKQKQYFVQTIGMTIVAFLFDMVLFYIFATKEVLAVGTLLTALVWFLVCEQRDNTYRFDKQGYFWIFFCLIIFLVSGIMLPILSGTLIYIVLLMLVFKFYLKKEIIVMISVVHKEFIYKKTV